VPDGGTEYSLILKLLAMDDGDEGTNAAKPLKIGVYDSIIDITNRMLVIVITAFNIYTEKI